MRRDLESLRQGLVGAWCPSLGYTGPLVVDRSARRRNGAAVGAWTAWNERLALACNGFTSAVTIPSAVSVIGGDFTVAFWFQLSAFNGTYLTLLDKGGSNQAREFSVFFNTSGNVTYAAFATTAADNTGSPLALGITTGSWQHIAITRIGSRVFYHRNGINTSSRDVTSATTSANFDWSFGDNPSLGGTKPVGAYDDIRMFNRALTQPEIALLASRRGIGLVPQRQRRTSASSKRLWINVGGTWRETVPYVNVSGTWKEAAVYRHDGTGFKN